MFDFFSTDFFSFSFLRKSFGFFRWVFIITDAFLVLSAVYVLRKALEFYPPFVSHKRIPYLKGAVPAGKVGVSMKFEWNGFLARARAATPDSFPLLVIEADKITDEALKRLGFQGETMLERIQTLARARKMGSLEGFWRAHKVRNEIAHTPNFSMPHRDVERHLLAYQRFLKELGCL